MIITGWPNYYTQQEKQLSETAKQWEFTAEYYERHSEPHGKTEPNQHAAPLSGHCPEFRESSRGSRGVGARTPCNAIASSDAVGALGARLRDWPDRTDWRTQAHNIEKL